MRHFSLKETSRKQLLISSATLSGGNFANEVILKKTVDSLLERILQHHERQSLMEQLAERGGEMGETAVYTASRALGEAL